MGGSGIAVGACVAVSPETAIGVGVGDKMVAFAAGADVDTDGDEMLGLTTSQLLKNPANKHATSTLIEWRFIIPHLCLS